MSAVRSGGRSAPRRRAAASSREQQVARTRQALIDAALELFSTTGYDLTTADDIAAAAGVSTRTFFRHFPTKESVLFFGGYEAAQLFAAALRNQPASTDEIDAIIAAWTQHAPAISMLRERIRRYEQAVSSSMVLRGRERLVEEHHVSVMAAAIAARRGQVTVDRSCRLLAQTCYGVTRIALTEWLNGPPSRALGDIIGECFAELATTFRQP